MHLFQFALMFIIALLLNVDFTILHSVRNTLAVVDLGSGGKSIAFFELFGAIPGAILMTWSITALLKRFSIQKVFIITLFTFISFFLLFSFVLYPMLMQYRTTHILSQTTLEFYSMLFYVMAELWKPALMGILFWGLINQHVPLEKAKSLYAPLMLAPSLGSIIAGPLVKGLTSEKIWILFPMAKELWTHSLTLLMSMLAILGLISAVFYYLLYQSFSPTEELSYKGSSISLLESIKTSLRVKDLRLLAWIVISCYIAYSLGEVIFFDILKKQFPRPEDYCAYMGRLSFYNGLLTTAFALFVTPWVLKRHRWIVGAIAMPICLLLTEGLFFVFLRGRFMWIEAAIFFGSIQYCLCRSVKYTLFDASKELVFISIDQKERLQGKLIIDGICSRLGRGSAAALSLSLVQIFGGIMQSAFVAGGIAISMGLSWLFATMKLSEKQLEVNPKTR